MIHVILLRGINVGGRNKVPMADLRAALTDAGYSNVATYIASGNVVADHPDADSRAHAERVETLMVEHFGVECRALVRSGADIRRIAETIPTDWVNGPGMKADVVYLFDDIDPEQVRQALGPREGIDTAMTAPGALLWMVTRADATRNGLQRLLDTPWYQQATVRNVNTARRLAAMVTDREERSPG